jgi:hypothetical protein
VGLVIACVFTPFGARWQFRRGVVECYGGLLKIVLENNPMPKGGISAITFGDMILGRTQFDLDHCRDHEHVHVRQAHRWGPFFLPAYLVASLIAAMRKRDPYRGNAFEIEAYAHDFNAGK